MVNTDTHSTFDSFQFCVISCFRSYTQTYLNWLQHIFMCDHKPFRLQIYNNIPIPIDGYHVIRQKTKPKINEMEIWHKLKTSKNYFVVSFRLTQFTAIVFHPIGIAISLLICCKNYEQNARNMRLVMTRQEWDDRHFHYAF